MVSIVIPTYKRSDFIQRAIDSILNQTYKDYEIIVVDDNEPNTTYRQELEKKMEKYRDNSEIIYIQHEKNKNGAAARNTGINLAKGDYITFLDDDDYFLPNRLEIMTKALDKNKEYGAAYSSVLVTRNKEIIGNIVAKKTGNYKKELLLNEFSFGTGSNMFFRREVIKELNGFDETFERHQDIETMIRFFRENNILAIPEYLVVKVQDDRSNEPAYEKYMKIKEHYFNAFRNDIDKLSENDKKQFYKNQYMMVLVATIKNKDYNHAKEIEKTILIYEKLNWKDKIKLLVYYINNYIELEKIKYKIKKYSLKKSIDKSIIEEMKKIEC